MNSPRFVMNILILALVHGGTGSVQKPKELEDSSAPKLLSFTLHRENMTNLSASKRQMLRQLRSGGTGVKIFDEVKVMGQMENMGYYYSYIHIGTPPQRFTVILDSGSVVTAVPCSECTTSGCGKHMDPGFSANKSSTAKLMRRPFSITYSEGSSLSGNYISDLICIGDKCRPDEAVRFEFGCANSMTNLFRTQLADGIMGMANTGSTIFNALRDHHQLDHDIFTLCLSNSGGYFSVGGYHTKRHWSDIVWTENADFGKYFRVKISEISLDGERVPSSVRALGATKISSGALLDSGTSLTYVPYDVFDALQSAFDDYCKSPGKCSAKTNNYEERALHCYDEFRDDETMDTFPYISFRVGEDQLCIPPQQYFFQSYGNTCIGFIKDNSFTLGANLMLDYDVIFDRNHSKTRIGFARASCRAPNVAPRCCAGQCSGQTQYNSINTPKKQEPVRKVEEWNTPFTPQSRGHLKSALNTCLNP